MLRYATFNKSSLPGEPLVYYTPTRRVVGILEYPCTSIRPSLSLVYLTSHLSFVGFYSYLYPRSPKGEGKYTVLPLSVCPSVRPIYFSSHLSVTVDGRNLIFGHKRHIGIPYCG